MSSKNISIEAQKIEVVKEWPKPKSVKDIQVFLGFINFYQQFIQGFNKIAVLFMSMLKIIVLSYMLVANEVLATNKVSSVKSSNKLIRKYKKLSKTRKLLKSLKCSKLGNLKSEKLFISQKSAKSRKKLSKNRNLSNFGKKKKRAKLFNLWH